MAERPTIWSMSETDTTASPTRQNPLFMGDRLPDDLPSNPFDVFAEWFSVAHQQQITANPNAMTIATIDTAGRPSARVVLCRKIDTRSGHVVFYTNRRSRKGREIDETGRVAVVFHFDAFNKSVRMEGIAVESPDWESDEYFKGRSIAKRLGAWASEQSTPIDSRDAFAERVVEAMDRFGLSVDDLTELDETPEGRERAAQLVPRPPHWGGYRVYPEAVELWVGNEARLHDRGRYTRELTPAVGPDGERLFAGGAWSATRLQP